MSPDTSTPFPKPMPVTPTDAGNQASRIDPGAHGDADAGAGAVTPRCVPEAGADEPDDDFVDSNCDGIDGDAASAVFVSNTGSDDAPGALAAPVQTLAHAIALATKSGKAVYVCDGTYTEAIELDTSGVSLYGGYDCTRGWQRETDRAKVVPKTGIAFTAKNVSAPMVVDRLDLRASDASGAGASSIAARVVLSKDVRFRNTLFAAGNAAKGVSGAVVADPMWVPQAPANDAVQLSDAVHCSAVGSAEGSVMGDPNCDSFSFGASGPSRTCPDGKVVSGGAGGKGDNWWLSGGTVYPGKDGAPSSGSVMDGSPGRSGSRGSAGARFGKLLLDGTYLPNDDAKDGDRGVPGQSGRGGDGGSSEPGNGSPAAAFTVGGGGGQGGYGGCGGQNGNHGKGGGASLALVVFDATVSVEQCTMQTGRGGDGGDGSDGAPGQKGGAGGAGAAPSDSSTFARFHGSYGGNGGDGGRGGAGGPGGGGPSIGILWSGVEPKTVVVTYALGTPGRGGVSEDVTAPDGVGGDSLSWDQAASAGQ